MTYTIIVVPFVVLTALVTLATLRRPAFAQRMAASAISAAVLLVLTAIFDNIMIGVGLIDYPEQHLSGLRIGIAPLEDFSYPLCAAFLVPAVYTLLARRPDREATT